MGVSSFTEIFAVSALMGDSEFFVVEVDEYDTAFFDKRSKFIHYHPRTLIMNNLEFDHADIFDDLEQIKKQFHFLVRTVPSNGLIVSPLMDGNLHDVLDMGCWTPLEHYDVESAAQWHAEMSSSDGSQFKLVLEGQVQGEVNWNLVGNHNVANALAAIAAARHAGVPVKVAIDALSEFVNVKRRLELRGEVNGISVYDDFAHHPTAIKTTLEGLKNKVGEKRVIAVLELRSNTMKMGYHARELPESLERADSILVFQGEDIQWDVPGYFLAMKEKAKVFNSTADIINNLCATTRAGDQVLIMSNGGFENIHQRLLDQLKLS